MIIEGRRTRLRNRRGSMESIHFVFIHLYSCMAPHCHALSRRITNTTRLLIYRSPVRLNSLIHFNWIKKTLVEAEFLLCNEHKLTLIITYGAFLYGWSASQPSSSSHQLMTIRKGKHCQWNNILSQVFMLDAYTIHNCS